MKNYTALAQLVAERSRANRDRLAAIKHEARESARALRAAAENVQVVLRTRERVKSIGKVPGFFPTPPALVRYMIAKAELVRGVKILEPEAGAGHIAEPLWDYDLTLVEVNTKLCEILRDKGFHPICADFLAWETDLRFDRIIMNPPFENLADTLHVRRAFELLAPKGILVAIMGAGAFFREDKKAREFRDWFDKNEGEAEKLPKGSFVASEVSTGVNTYLVKLKR